jgi:hypothetical protein
LSSGDLIEHDTDVWDETHVRAVMYMALSDDKIFIGDFYGIVHALNVSTCMLLLTSCCFLQLVLMQFR